MYRLVTQSKSKTLGEKEARMKGEMEKNSEQGKEEEKEPPPLPFMLLQREGLDMKVTAQY